MKIGGFAPYDGAQGGIATEELSAMVASDGKQVGVRRIVIAIVAAVIGVGALGAAQPYGHPTTNIELRVWQGIEDRTDIAIGARAIGRHMGRAGDGSCFPSTTASAPTVTTATDRRLSRSR